MDPLDRYKPLRSAESFSFQGGTGWDSAAAQPRTRNAKRWDLLLRGAVGLSVLMVAAGLAFGGFGGAGRTSSIEVPCQSDLTACMLADPEVAAEFTDREACDVPERSVCLVAVGDTSLELLDSVASNLRTKLGLPVYVLPPLDVPPETMNSKRRQFDGTTMAKLSYFSYSRIIGNRDSLLVVITPVDIYIPEIPNWRFAFGVPFRSESLPTYAIVSTFRFYYPRGGSVTERTQKMVNKYVGLDFFGLSLSSDPRSPMYNHILSVRDLDRMADELPVGAQ
jgi:hypothetical protein